MTDDVVVLTNHIGIERVNILKWSMGSNIGQSLGIRHPDRIITIVLVSIYMRCLSRSDYILTG